MNFKEAYDHFLEGTATDGEIEFVREEMKRAREIDAILESVPDSGIFNEAEPEAIKKARKQFNFKNTIRIIIVVICVLAFLAAAICGYIFGTAIPAARRIPAMVLFLFRFINTTPLFPRAPVGSEAPKGSRLRRTAPPKRGL